MTVVRGQIYQYNLNPMVFFSIQRVYSVNQILIMNVDTRAQTYFTQTRLLSTCTLVDSVPPNRLHNGYHFTGGAVTVSLAFALTTPFTSGRVLAHGTVTKPRAFAPTYLQGRTADHASVTSAGLINPLVLGGHFASKGRTVQASLN